MVKRRATKTAKRKRVYKQTGTSVKKIDKKLKAKKAGWRKSKKTGKLYFENRANRSDKNKKTKL